MEYRLLNWEGTPLNIIIDENSKDDFKRMMEWTEENWKAQMSQIKNNGKTNNNKI